jgi:hypothetical protein
MLSAIQTFIDAHEHCRTLELFLQRVNDPADRAVLRAELIKAYNNLEHEEQTIVGVRFAERGSVASAN